LSSSFVPPTGPPEKDVDEAQMERHGKIEDAQIKRLEKREKDEREAQREAYGKKPLDEYIYAQTQNALPVHQSYEDAQEWKKNVIERDKSDVQRLRCDTRRRLVPRRCSAADPGPDMSGKVESDSESEDSERFCTVMLTGIPLWWTEAVVRSHFEECGPIRFIIKATESSRGENYTNKWLVTFADVDGAHKCVRKWESGLFVDGTPAVEQAETDRDVIYARYEHGHR
jgi:hypothetical protein